MAEPAAIREQVGDVEGDLTLFCPNCFYDLRGTTAETCPECGTTLDREKLAKSAIPWVHREGRTLRAFLRTVWVATFKTQLFCLEVARPVSLTDARKFRRQVVALLTVAVMLAAAFFVVIIEDFRDPMEDLWRNRPLMMVLLAVLPVIPVWLFMLAFTGVHMYWFHPKVLSVQQQNRALAVSHYACAPLVGLIPAVILFGIGNLIGVIGDANEIDSLIWIALGIIFPAFVLAVVSLAAYLFVCAHMARFAAHRSGPARATLWLGLPILWLGLIGLLFFVFPLVVFYIYLVIASF